MNEEQLVKENIGLVHRVVNSHVSRFRYMGMYRDDLIQEGTIGLIRAIRKYDPKRAKFSTYACIWIKALVCRFTDRNYSLIPITNSGRYPSKNSPPPNTWVSGQRLLCKRADDCRRISLESTPIDEWRKEPGYNEDGPGYVSADLINLSIQITDMNLESMNIPRFLMKLSPVERKILRWHLGLNKKGRPVTLEGIATRLGTSRQSVHEKYWRALRKLKKYILVDAVGVKAIGNTPRTLSLES
jgi:RNA polymerase primary sigma factor